MSYDRDKRSSSGFLVAILLALLLHFVGMMSVYELSGLFSDDTIEEEEFDEITLVDPPEPEPEPAPEPEPVAKLPNVPPPPPLPPPKPIQPPPEPKVQPIEPPSSSPVASSEPDNSSEPVGAPDPDEEPGPSTTIDPAGVNLNLDWSRYQQTFGEEMNKKAQEYAQKSLEKRRRRGGGYGSMTPKVRKALTNNKSWVKSSDQEPLGDRKRLMRSYIEIAHDKIHVIFGDGFLGSLTNLGSSHPLNNLSLHVITEFEINSNGHVDEVRVVRTSGSMVFDAAAVDSIYRSSPYRPPPKAILSWNNKLYLRWGFYRNNRMCGVFNVEPYILKEPGGVPQAIPEDHFIIDG